MHTHSAMCGYSFIMYPRRRMRAYGDICAYGTSNRMQLHIYTYIYIYIYIYIYHMGTHGEVDVSMHPCYSCMFSNQAYITIIHTCILWCIYVYMEHKIYKMYNKYK